MSKEKETTCRPVGYPGLSTEQIERFACLIEELGEAQQTVGKILRHGLYSYDPTNKEVVLDEHGDYWPNNRTDLEEELGHVLAAIHMLIRGSDIKSMNLSASKIKKLGRINKYLHHQPEYITNV